ncbi:MAG TPA: hypothetical protein EYG80_00095 [Flavobacteriaceae bacterium]|nr:hypothetical protein [Flavobacteriaceae bacterium]HIP26039.1 hypothetical protein [Flavobacteriaceae bacterium]
MAKRPIFIPNIQGNQLYNECEVEFKWNPGFAKIQKQKNIQALHEEAKKYNLYPILEVSSKSEELLGQRLSAFSLKTKTKEYGEISIECAFQGSKVFENNIQYNDIYSKTSLEAKKDTRIRNSGKLIGFNYMGDEWELEPKSAFYDWLYIQALYPHKDYLKKLFKYEGFTDIEFNPNKSINCQARTCAIIVSLLKKDLYNEAMSSKERFIEIIYAKQFIQGTLL